MIAFLHVVHFLFGLVVDCISNVTSKNQQFVNDQLVFDKLLILAISNDQVVSLWQIADFSHFQ